MLSVAKRYGPNHIFLQQGVWGLFILSGNFDGEKDW
jgi:hypothetical protein